MPKNIFGSIFTRIEEVGGKIVAYTENYTNDENALVIKVDLPFGCVNID